MMKLSLMKNVFETVNSDWDCELAKELIIDWEHDENWVKMWRASANFVCFFRNNNSNYVTRFNRDSERSLTALEAEINLLNYLDLKKAQINKPVISKNGRFISKTKTNYGYFYTIVFKRIFGEEKEMSILDLNGFYEWGKSLGKLHEIIKNIPVSLKINRKTHQELLDELVTEVPLRDKIQENEYRRIKKWLHSLSITQTNYGLIHYDFDLSNLIWNDEGITIIDFDDCIYSWYIADIAYALRDLFYEGEKIDVADERFLKFVDGNKEMTKLPDEEFLQIPYFFKLHNFITFKKVQRSLDLEINKENPEWMNNLIRKLKTDYMERYYRNFQNVNIW